MKHTDRNASGQASLPEACPVCLHEPVKPDDCRPNKALRTTIKVFLKKKVIERDTTEKKKRAAEKAAAAPLTDQIPAAVVSAAEGAADQPSSTTTSLPHKTDISVPLDGKSASRDASQAPQTPSDPAKATGPLMPTEAQKDVPQMSIEVSDRCAPFPQVN